MRIVWIFPVAVMFWASIALGQLASGVYESHAILEAEKEVVLSSEMGGRLKSLNVPVGGVFAKGDVLAEFSCDILDAERGVTVAHVEAATAKLKNAKRLDKLNAAGALDLVLAQATLDEARAQLEVAKSRADLCHMVAPYDGGVLSHEVRSFESVDIMTPILRVGQVGALRVNVIAPAAWLSWLRPDAPFSFSPKNTAISFRGRIDQIGASVDPASQTIKIEGVLIENTQNLLPGQGGVVRFHSTKGAAE
jgi:membrane fusion protein (multidrug efflux system)